MRRCPRGSRRSVDRGAHRPAIEPRKFRWKNRLPAIYPERKHAEAGGLIAYGPSVPDNFRRAAGYVARILRGEKPGDLPVVQPTKLELVINLKTARPSASTCLGFCNSARTR